MKKDLSDKNNSNILNPDQLNSKIAGTIGDLAQLPYDLTQLFSTSNNATNATSLNVDNLTGEAVTTQSSGTSFLNQAAITRNLAKKNDSTPISSLSETEIETPGYVSGGRQGGFGLSDIFPPILPDSRAVKFNLVHRGTAQGQVWVIIHGWTKDITPFTNLAGTVAAAKPGDTVLTLDWTSIAGTPLKDLPGLAARDNTDAATWINSIAKWAVNKLKDLGVKGESLNLIGQSLGAFVCSEIGYVFKKANNFGVNQIIALDPASAINTAGGYDLDNQTPGGQGPKRFDEVSKFSRAFLGTNSSAGNAEIASWAHESILMDFDTFIDAGQEHAGVVETFKRFIDPNQLQLAANLFTLDDNRVHDEFRQNFYHSGGGSFFTPDGRFEGVISATLPNQYKFFIAVKKDTSLSVPDHVVYGTMGDDQLLQSLNPLSPYFRYIDGNNTFYGGKGNDRIEGGRNNDELYGDEDNDQLFGGGGIDKLYGGDGNDTLDGGSNNDELYGNKDNDTLTGGEGSDKLYGGDNNDILIGVLPAPESANPGLGEIDTLTGGSGSDTFVLGDAKNVFYDDGNPNVQGLGGLGEYALITDFNLAEGDLIQLKRTSREEATTVGYYDMNSASGNFNQLAPIRAAGLPGVGLGDLSAADLKDVDVLFVQNPSNSGYGAEYLSRLADIETAVKDGMVLVIHDRFVEDAESILPGGSTFQITRNVDYGLPDNRDINIVDNSTLVTNGPGGTLNDTILDGGNYSNHGFAVAGTLPGDASFILSQTSPQNLVTFSYKYGAGAVVYSTIPLDYYLAGYGPDPAASAFRSMYAPNVVAYAASLSNRNDYTLGPSPVGTPEGTGIFLNNDLIAVLQGVPNGTLNPTSPSFVYV